MRRRLSLPEILFRKGNLDHPTTCPLRAYDPMAPLVLNVLQFTQKLRRLETMKISKFVWSALVAFATVALIAPHQVEAIIIDGRVNGQIVLTGSGTITESNGINGDGIKELDFNGIFFPHGPLSATKATGDFIP